MNLAALIGVLDADQFFDPARPGTVSQEPKTGFAKLFADNGLSIATMSPYRYVFVDQRPAIGIWLETETQSQEYGEGWNAVLTLNMVAPAAWQLEDIQDKVRTSLFRLNSRGFAEEPDGTYDIRMCRALSATRNVVDSSFVIEAVHNLDFGFNPKGG